MAEVYVTLGEAAELERVKYNTMVKRVLRKQESFVTKTEKSEKNKKYLTFKIGGQWKRVASVKVSIPPRPFLGISEEDEQDIKDTLEEIFEE